MKRILVLSSSMIALLCTVQPAAAACTVCHSKNPKMVNMHKALEHKDCFKCHGPASDRKSPNSENEITTEPLCVSCHKKELSPQQQP